MFEGDKVNFKRIVCPVDLSLDSSESLRYGVALARSYQAKLFVLHCTSSDSDEVVHHRPELERIISTVTREYIGSSTLPALECESVIVRGEPYVEIAREAAERRADLIVMRSRRRPYAAALLGSVAESVCRMAPCPTLVTHAQEREWADRISNKLELKRVLVAYDFSSDSELALSYGLSFAQKYGAELHVLHVVASRPRETTPVIPQSALSAEISFSRTVGALKIAVPQIMVGGWMVRHAVREGHPYREVLTYAEEQAVELICMGASGTGFGMRALFGSNADRVLRQAPCPILISRPLKPAVAAPQFESSRANSGASFAAEARGELER